MTRRTLLIIILAAVVVVVVGVAVFLGAQGSDKDIRCPADAPLSECSNR